MYNLNKVMYKPYKSIKPFLVDLHLSILSKNPFNVNEFMGFKPLFPPYKQYTHSQFVHIVYKIC